MHDGCAGRGYARSKWGYGWGYISDSAHIFSSFSQAFRSVQQLSRLQVNSLISLRVCKA